MILRLFLFFSQKLEGLNVVSDKGETILERRYIVNKKSFGIYLHRCAFPDEDSNLFHDHPWAWSFSIVLSGFYVEKRPGYGQEDETRVMTPFSINILGKNTFHRLSKISAGGAWTIYFRGKRVKQDGFLQRMNNGHWRHILAIDAAFEFKETKQKSFI